MALTTTTDTINAGLYARISKDSNNKGLGVARQEKDCRALAAMKGWTVADTYIDNDQRASRINGKLNERPEFARLIEDLKSGAINAVIAWDFDRMFRDPLEQERFFVECEMAGLHYVATVGDEVDIASGEGIMIARIKGAVNAEEVRKLSKRSRRKHQELAENGLPSGGGLRPFGWSCNNRQTCKLGDDVCAHDGRTLIAHEADMLRDAVRGIIAGGSISGTCRAWNDAGKLTGTGSLWRPATLRNIITRPRLVGRRMYQGEDVGEAVWEPILDRATWEKLMSLMNDPGRRTNGTRSGNGLLLSGLLRCGRCGAKLAIAPSQNRLRYRCGKVPGRGGCNGLAIAAEPLDKDVVEAVLRALDTPELLAGFDEAAKDAPDSESLTGIIEAAEKKLLEYADDYDAGLMTRAEWLRLRKRAEERKEQARRELSKVRRVDVLDDLGVPGALREEWPNLPDERRRAVLATIIDRIVISPAVRGRNRFDPTRVDIEWRV